MRRSWPKRLAVLLATGTLGLSPLPASGTALAAPTTAATASAWTIQPSPNEPGATASVLNAVSCVRTGACAAVGTYYTATGEPRHQYALALERTGWSQYQPVASSCDQAPHGEPYRPLM